MGVSSTTVDFANSTASQQLTWTFDYLALDSSTTYYYVFANDTTAATVADSSNLTTSGFELNVGNPYTGGQAYQANGTGADWDFEFEAVTNSIPEPATMGLFAAFGGAVFFVRRKLMM